MTNAAPLDPFAGLYDDIAWLRNATRDQALRYYDELLHDPSVLHTPGYGDRCLAILGRFDRFFLLTHLLRRADALHPWLYARCREVEAAPDDHLDLWARDHYKSTIITFAGAIQEILLDPEVTIGIFSHTRPIAKKFLEQIKHELESNDELKRVYPDVLFQKPQSESPFWSVENGIVVRRKSNPKEKTVEAWGLVDGQPTSTHFALAIFDDTVTRESVTTPEQIVKTTEAWELAQNLLRSSHPRKWMIGTRYKYADTYEQLMARGAVTPRVYPATEDGTYDGTPVFLAPEVWEKKKRESTIKTIACQQLQNPQAGSEQKLKVEWLRMWEVRPQTLNVYIMADYAGGRPTQAARANSNTAFVVIGVDAALNKYFLDGAVHQMTLSGRWEMLKKLRNKWIKTVGVQVVEVGYERYGAQSDIEHFETMMQLDGDSFPIEELAWPRDGDGAKDNRIERLEPDLRNWKMYIPYNAKRIEAELRKKGKPVPEQLYDLTKTQRQALAKNLGHLIAEPVKQINEEGKVYDVVEYIINNEYLFFPNTTRKDGLDAWSRIYDMNVCAPVIYSDTDLTPEADPD